jgi:hypothetical protein
MFSFSVDLPEGRSTNQYYTHELAQYPNFKLFRLSGKVLLEARNRRSCVPFGFAVSEEHIRFFVKPVGRRVFDFVVRKTGPSVEARVFNHTHVVFTRHIKIDPVNPALFNIGNYEPARHVGGMMGDPVALTNYGDYLQSSSGAAMSLASKIYRSLGCERPLHLSKFACQFPTYPENVIRIQAGRTTEFVGHSSVRRVRLIAPGEDVDVQNLVRINLNNPQPREVEIVENRDMDEGMLV